MTSYIKERTALTASFLYTIMWSIGGILVDRNYMNFYSVRDEIQWYIIVSIIVFNTVYLITRHYNYVFNPVWEISSARYEFIRNCNIFAYIFMIPVMFAAIKIISTDGWAALRVYAYDTSGSVLISTQVFALYTLVLHPIFIATILLTTILVVSKSKYSKQLIILSLMDLTISTVSFGGRTAFVRAMAFIVFALAFKAGMCHMRIRLTTKQIVLGVGSLALLIFLTSLRSHKGLSFLESMYTYLYGSIVYFDVITGSVVGYKSINDVLLYGNGMFGFITSIPQFIIYQFTKINNVPEYLVNLTSNDFLMISSTVKYNALPTMLYTFWRDGRMVGIIIGTILISGLYIYFKNQAIKRESMVFYALLIYVSYVIVNATMSYTMITMQQSMILVFIVLFTRKVQYIGKNGKKTFLAKTALSSK